MTDRPRTPRIKEVINPKVNPRRFLHHAMANDYGMQEGLVRPDVCARVVEELEDNDLLQDLELRPAARLAERGLYYSALLHTVLTSIVVSVDPNTPNPLPLFSVRVFEPNHYSTTIHRNDPDIGPWAVGITLAGEAPFNVYEQDQLPQECDATIDLTGTDRDPVPFDSMQADTGSAWTLNTDYEQLPHSGGLVESSGKRVLLLFYGYRYASGYLNDDL